MIGFTPEALRAKGYVPDGKGGFVKDGPLTTGIAPSANQEPARFSDANHKIVHGYAPLIKREEPWPSQNKWEREFGEYLRATRPKDKHFPQGLTFRLAKKTSYTPDWITHSERAPFLIAWEIKGFWRQAGRIKIKMAARLFPFVAFIAVTRPGGKAGGWKFETISP